MTLTFGLSNHRQGNGSAAANSPTRLIEEDLQLRLRAKTVGRPQSETRLPIVKGRVRPVTAIYPQSNKALLAALDDDA